jgi:hypothetical protein
VVHVDAVMDAARVACEGGEEDEEVGAKTGSGRTRRLAEMSLRESPHSF